MNINYKIITKFKINGIEMVVVKFSTGTHVMPVEEWERVHKCLKKKRRYIKQRKHKIA